MPGVEPEPDPRLIAALEAHGRDAVCFQSLESGIVPFVDEHGVVPYADTGSAWLGIGTPLAETERIPELARRFVEAARRAGRRVSFVGVEDLALLPGHRGLLLGEQPIFVPADWPKSLAAKKSLREQLRRAKAKGVRVRRVTPEELEGETELRARIRELARLWLLSRRMEPLQFLVSLEPFHAPASHRYFVAEREGRVIAFASAIPIPARRGFMLEDVLRDDDVPNGTTELLFDAVMRDVDDASMLTLGLAPLTGDVPRWLALLRDATRPLYDFEGLRAFKQRMQPVRWEPVHLAIPPGERGVLHVIECLRAFAGGSLVRFGVLSLVRHPSGPPWALVVPLFGWIVLRLGFALAGRAWHFAASPLAVVLWSMLDVVLAALLFRAALRPRADRLALATSVAALVALRSTIHVVHAGLGVHPFDAILRVIMVLAPTLGTLALGWAALRRRAFERGARDELALPHL